MEKSGRVEVGEEVGVEEGVLTLGIYARNKKLHCRNS